MLACQCPFLICSFEIFIDVTVVCFRMLEKVTIFERTFAHARRAHMHLFLSVTPVDQNADSLEQLMLIVWFQM